MRSRDANLVILRGLPGSGKSTLAQRYFVKALGYTLVEADQFMVQHGVYKYDPSNVSRAHALAKAAAFAALSEGRNVVIANTFVTAQDIQNYLDHLAPVKRGYKVMHVRGPAAFRSVHDVPDAAIERMRNRWQTWLGEIPLEAGIDCYQPCLSVRGIFEAMTGNRKPERHAVTVLGQHVASRVGSRGKARIINADNVSVSVNRYALEDYEQVVRAVQAFCEARSCI
jgi:predicted kinase